MRLLDRKSQMQTNGGSVIDVEPPFFEENS
jgi:hypothetical protein